LRETYSFELEDQLAKETRGVCSNTPATASSSTGSTAVLTSVATISVASGDRSTTSIWKIRLFKHFGQKVPDLADGLRTCHDMDFVNSLRLPLVDRGAVDGIDEWSQERVARKNCDRQDRGLRRKPYTGQCAYSG
jgi:hypothetical protein